MSRFRRLSLGLRLRSILLFLSHHAGGQGVLLMFYYVPTADHAYASTNTLFMTSTTAWFLLGTTSGAPRPWWSGVFAHMSQVFSGARIRNRANSSGWLGWRSCHRHGIRLHRLFASWDSEPIGPRRSASEIMDKMPLLATSCRASSREVRPRTDT